MEITARHTSSIGHILCFRQTRSLTTARYFLRNLTDALFQPRGNQQLRFVITNRISPHITAGRKAKIPR